MGSLYVDDGYVEDGYVQTGITVLWGSRVIFVPRSETTLVQSVPSEVRELDLEFFRRALKDAEDAEDGISYPDTHVHNTTVVVGGLTLGRVVQIINGYTVVFEDGVYAVNVVGGNTNMGDVLNRNSVGVNFSNSAGFIVYNQPVNVPALSPTQETMLLEMYRLLGLDPTRPLVVSPASRRVPANGADIDQTVQEVNGVVTVTRQ
jgi:hypothetical protein